jgi:ribosomal protein S17
MQAQGRRKTLVGEVVSNKMVKTVTVRVDRLTKHPQFALCSALAHLYGA